jgi:hypothetical protein
VVIKIFLFLVEIDLRFQMFILLLVASAQQLQAYLIARIVSDYVLYKFFSLNIASI